MFKYEPLFECLRCHASLLNSQVEKDAGEWIVRCACGARNVVGVTLVGVLPLPNTRWQLDH